MPHNGDTLAPPPPVAVDVWEKTSQFKSHYCVRHPWQWIMKSIASETMIEVAAPTELPSAKKAANGQQQETPTTPSLRRSRRQAGKKIVPSTLKIELCDKDGEVWFKAYGTSSAFDGLEDKDELVRTIQRCRCEDLDLSPPSILISWDVTREECLNVVGKDLPALKTNNNAQKMAVLKEPMGSQGKGIYFVRNAEEIHDIVDEHRKRALEEPNLLDNLIAAKGRIPSWVLQAEVIPCLYILGGRKFHIRTYVVGLERISDPSVLDLYMFTRHEARVAGVPVSGSDTDRDRLAHITNGALSDTTERLLVHDIPELTSRNIQEKVELFVALAFGKHFFPDIERRVMYSGGRDEGSDVATQKFAVAGLDLMVTSEGRPYLLEVNVNPAAPPESTVNDTFKDHLKGFMHSLVDLVVGRSAKGFIKIHDVLRNHGVSLD